KSELSGRAVYESSICLVGIVHIGSEGRPGLGGWRDAYRLIAEGFVDLVGERLATQEAVQVRREDIHQPPVRLWAVRRHVRRDDHVRESPERVVGRQRLGF